MRSSALPHELRSPRQHKRLPTAFPSGEYVRRRKTIFYGTRETKQLDGSQLLILPLRSKRDLFVFEFKLVFA